MLLGCPAGKRSSTLKATACAGHTLPRVSWEGSIQDRDCVVCGTHCWTIHMCNLKSTLGCTQASFLVERTRRPRRACARRLTYRARRMSSCATLARRGMRLWPSPLTATPSWHALADESHRALSRARHLRPWLRRGSQGSRMRMQPAGPQVFDSRRECQKDFFPAAVSRMLRAW